MNAKTAFILGAGFSRYAGIPLQAGFAEAVLRAREFQHGKPSQIIVERAQEFVSYAFNVAENDLWPEWEDLFTCIDLSANSGHHLGREYEPSLLRTLRRALLARIIRMLDQAYGKAIKSADPEVRQMLQKLDHFLSLIDVRKSVFISLNWDDILERRLDRLKPGIPFDYGPHVSAAVFAKKDRVTVDTNNDSRLQGVLVAKMHGAVNWLYCDACRQQFSFPPGRSGSVAKQIMRPKDWQGLRAIRSSAPRAGRRRCPFCGVVLGTRMATFSYRKVLDSPVFLKTWFFAEDLLREARNWVFVGYSLPDADYEFKYLLKRIQLSRPEPPRLSLIDTSPETMGRFRRFFGDQLPQESICLDGLGANAISMLQEFDIVSLAQTTK